VTDTPLDLGNGYEATFYSWAPDHELNPQYAAFPDQEHAGIILRCGPHSADGSVLFAGRMPLDDRAVWTVEQEDPLTLSPSIAAPCGCHGFIREGKWVDA
jgi:hypothetical protein